MLDMGDSVFTIIWHGGKWKLLRKLRKDEIAKHGRYWLDENGDRWIYLFPSDERHKLERCVKKYHTIETELIEITKIAAGDLKNDEKGEVRL